MFSDDNCICDGEEILGFIQYSNHFPFPSVHNPCGVTWQWVHGYQKYTNGLAKGLLSLRLYTVWTTDQVMPFVNGQVFF